MSILARDFEQVFLELPPEDAKKLARACKEAENTEEPDPALDLANKLLEGHGVEAIRGDYHVDNYFYDIVALFVNMGETYATTLLYATDEGRFYIMSYGDWVEANETRYNIT